ncbi:MAG: hypothetical protein KA479_10055 [Saprospiraceae bacterium]|nr:hypothetical protein [Saprospiraceae bacterium]
MQTASDWTRIMTLLEDYILQGTQDQPLPAPVKALLDAWGIVLSDDPAQAALEAVSILSPLRNIALIKHTLPSEEQAPDPGHTWTPSQIRIGNELMAIPGAWGLHELAGILRRLKWPFPESALHGLFALLNDNPDLFADVADLLGDYAIWMTRQSSQHQWLYPAGPPDKKVVKLVHWPRYLFHWLWHDPVSANSWILENIQVIKPDIWSAFMQQYSYRLPPTSLPVLNALQKQLPLTQGPLFAARSRLGDKTVSSDAETILRPMIQFTAGKLDVQLPPPGPLWGNLLLLEPDQTQTRSLAFQKLFSCLSSETVASWVQMDVPAFIAAACSSPQAEIWMTALYDQLLLYPHPQGILTRLRYRLAHPEITCDRDETVLAHYLAHAALSAEISRHIHEVRYNLDMQGPAGQILCCRTHFWSEELTRDVLQSIQAKPIVAFEAARHPTFLQAFCWRGHLGFWSRQLQNARPLGELPPLFLKQKDEITTIIQMRMAMHKAFQPNG